MERAEQTIERDELIHETAAGLPQEDGETLFVRLDESLALYVVSLFGIPNAAGELLNGDALLVRPRGTAHADLLAAVLNCKLAELTALLTQSGTWAVREVAEIDGHRLRFEPN